MENSAVVWLPYPEREKEETEFVIVTQCSFKCKKNFKTKKRRLSHHIFHLVAEFIVAVIMYFML